MLRRLMRCRFLSPRATVAALPLIVILNFLDIGVAARSSAAEEYREMQTAVSPRVADAELLTAADPQETLPMSVTLHVENRAALDALLAAQQQPGSPEYHRWLSPREFGERFGCTPDTYDALAEWLRGQGFTVRAWPGRLRLDFTGTAGGVEAAFGVRMNAYLRHGRRALANAGP